MSKNVVAGKRGPAVTVTPITECCRSAVFRSGYLPNDSEGRDQLAWRVVWALNGLQAEIRALQLSEVRHSVWGVGGGGGARC